MKRFFVPAIAIVADLAAIVSVIVGCAKSDGKIVAKGEIRFFQHGTRGRLKFKPEWIDEFVERNTVAPMDDSSQPTCVKRTRKPRVPATDESVCGFGWDLLKNRG